MSASGTHLSHRTWVFPPERPPLEAPLRRVNLRSLAARPGRFEHHLLVVATVGDAQLEIATASEPLYFAHENISDEYVVALKTGDALLDQFPFRVFLTDPNRGEHVGRIKHGAHDLILHPHGLSHWPGKLRPPYTSPMFPGGRRRASLSLVFCGNRPVPPAPDRQTQLDEGRRSDAKAYVEPSPPLHLQSLKTAPVGVLAQVGDATLSKVELPFVAERDAYLMVLEPNGSGDAFSGDLIHLPAGARFEGSSAGETLVLAAESERGAAPPPGLWDAVPPPPFERFEDGERGVLPIEIDSLVVEEAGDNVRVCVGTNAAVEVPRYWLARTLYRIALHTMVEDTTLRSDPAPRLGLVETYGGFYYDDRSGAYRLGVRPGDFITIAPDDLSATLERLYRAVAPDGYMEEL